MKTVLEEVTRDTVEATHVRRRVDDWEQRLKALCAAIEEWLPAHWEAHSGEPLLLHEKMMQEYGVQAKPLPTLELRGPTGRVVKLQPHALWILGNNGRVDMKCGGRRYHIIDMAENFEEPNWQAAPTESRRNLESVTRDWLSRILRSAARTMNKSEYSVERGSDNVFTDLGFPEADTHLLKAELVSIIDAIIRQRRTTQAKAARTLGLSRSDLSGLHRGDFREYSLEHLFRFLMTLGGDIDVVIRQPQSDARGKLRIAAPELG